MTMTQLVLRLCRIAITKVAAIALTIFIKNGQYLNEVFQKELQRTKA